MSILEADRTIIFAPPQGSARAPRGSLATLWLMCVAVRDSLFAYRRYEHLTSQGTPHRAAITRALGASAPRDA